MEIVLSVCNVCARGRLLLPTFLSLVTITKGLGYQRFSQRIIYSPAATNMLAVTVGQVQKNGPRA